MQLRTLAANDVFGALQLMVEINEGSVAGFISQAEVNGYAPLVEGLPSEVSSNTALIVESSGSTGIPKRIELSLEALRHSAKASAARLGGEGQWLLALPVNFIAGANVLFRSVIADTQPILMNTQLPFTVEAFVRGASLMDQGNRFTSLVPAQLAKLAAAARDDAFVFSTLRKFSAILVGGQTPNMGDVLELRSRGINVVVSYGMTETSGGCVYDGVPLDGVKVSLQSGLVEISGPVLANGLGESFLTNDLGQWVNDRLEILGRADRVIVSGGLKLSLDHFEQRARELAGVEDLIALALDSAMGQSVGVIYIGSENADFGSLSESISLAARPKRVVRVDSLPRLSSGKPDLLAARRALES
jgi:O-succinylbenzoic acid--CoA ligase